MGLFKNKRQLGKCGEQIACDYLVRSGYRILHRNYYTPAGELDIVAQDDTFLVFAEVKQRTESAAQAAYGRPALAVNRTKQRHIVDSARYYLQKEEAFGQIRFDVIEVLTSPTEGGFVGAKIEHIQNAFRAN